MRISMTRNSSAQSVSELIACLKVGRAREFPIRKFSGAGSNASTRSTHFFAGYERSWAHARPAFARWLRCGGSTAPAVVWRSVSVLAETQFHFVWRTHPPDRGHANRAGRGEKMDLSVTLFAPPEPLDAASR